MGAVTVLVAEMVWEAQLIRFLSREKRQLGLLLEGGPCGGKDGIAIARDGEPRGGAVRSLGLSLGIWGPWCAMHGPAEETDACTCHRWYLKA